MSPYVPWNSQPRSDWSAAHAPGKFIDLEGHPTHYLKMGSGEPLILLHGFFFDSFMWDRSIGALAQEYTVYAPDLWGFGYSTRQPLDYGYPLYARQLLAFMDALGIERASLIGQSMGAGTIIRFTVSHPGRVGKIVLVNAAGMPNPLPLMGRLSNLPLVGELLYWLPGNFIRRMTLGSTFLHRKELITEEFFTRATRFMKIRGTSQIMLETTRRSYFDTLEDQIRALGALDVPALIVWGRQEKSIPLAAGEALHRMLPGSRLEVLENAGHCSNIDQPEQFNRLALEFLA